MIPAHEAAFQASLNAMSKEEVVAAAMDIYRKFTASDTALKEYSRSDEHFLQKYKDMKNALAKAEERIKELEHQLSHLTGIKTIQTNALFGRKSEKLDDILKSSSGEAPSDPLDESAGEGTSGSGGVYSFKNHNTHHNRSESGEKKKIGKRSQDLSNLPVCEVYEYDLDELNSSYGKGKWRFAFWRKHEQVEIIKRTTYLKITYTPVISVGLDHALFTIPYDGALIPKSLVSSSLAAEIMTDKFALYLPTYRQEHAIDRFGIPLSRQTMVNWVNKLSHELLKPAYDYLCGLLRLVSHQQCDETSYLVVIDGMDPGHKGYVWIHRTSELLEDPTIIVYCYENSRAADHLRNFYEGLTGHITITCDAYSGYPAFEKDFPEKVTLSGCLMHARRKFVYAFAVVNTKGMDDTAINDLPEMKGIVLANEIFDKDLPLKFLPPEERLRLRQETVKSSVDKYFEFIHGFNIEDPSISEKLREAITYSINNESRLRRFLDDPFIPLDNGACERSVKSIALGRRNYLFSYSLRGAEANMVITTLIETAKACSADPYYYLKYLLDTMPGHVYRGVPLKNEQALLPWSEEFRQYEKSQKELLLSVKAPPGNDKPKTPKKTDLCVVKKTA